VLSLLSRQSLLALERLVHAEEDRVARVGAAVVARDLVADLEALQSVVSSPRLQKPDADAASWRNALAASSRTLRLGDGVCRTDAAGRAIACVPDSLARRLAHPDLGDAIRQAIASQRPIVSTFATQIDRPADAVAAVPITTAETQGAAVAVIAVGGVQPRDIFGTGRDLTVMRRVPDDRSGGDARVAGTPWFVHAAALPGIDETILAFRRRSLLVEPSIAALALLLAWALMLGIQRPLTTLTNAAERIAAGNLDDPILEGNDEIGRLATALERMRLRLKASIDATEHANTVLERRVEERTAQLQRLLAKVISAQEDERRRVARELHDETSQVLAALGMALHAGAPERAVELKALVDRINDSLHRLIVNLRPTAIDDLGLAAAIRVLADSQLGRAGVNVRCELDGLEERRLDPAVEIALFRVVQEALLNIKRHSNATNVLIEGGVVQGRLWIEIADNGRGFDPESIDPGDMTLRGIGLEGMRERMELLGGHFEIDSAPGRGTRVHVGLCVLAPTG
jgi:signal transduction histidine kinase